MFSRICAVALAVALLAGCENSDDVPVLDLRTAASAQEIRAATSRAQPNGRSFTVGFDLRIGLKEDSRQYLPLLAYLGRATGYSFNLHYAREPGELARDLASGWVAFAVIGAGSYLPAHGESTIVPLVRGLNAAGEPGYRSVFVVPPDSPLRSLTDLRGKRLALGATTSTQGNLIPRIMLHEAGLSLAELVAFHYTGSHRACAQAVLSGLSDACALQDTLAHKLIAEGRARALVESRVFPSSGIFASARVAEPVRERVREALLAFDPMGRDREGLHHWADTEMAGGFVAARDADYAPLAKLAARLGLMGNLSRPPRDLQCD